MRISPKNKKTAEVRNKFRSDELRMSNNILHVTNARLNYSGQNWTTCYKFEMYIRFETHLLHLARRGDHANQRDEIEKWKRI